MTFSNLYLLFRNIAAHFYQFHAVEQGAGYSADIIRSRNKHDLGQIVVYIQKIIMESTVLFRVEYFQQSRRRVAIHCILGHFVYLV